MKTSVVKVLALLFAVGVMTSCLEDGSVDDFLEQQEEDKAIIEAYLAENNLDAQTFNSTIYKITKVASNSSGVTVDDIVDIKLNLWKLSDSTVLYEDSSFIYMPKNGLYLPELVGSITGPNLSVASMKEGEKSVFIYTSNLMFGEGSGTYNDIRIDQNEIIAATIELIDIRSEEEQKDYEAEILKNYAIEKGYIEQDDVPLASGVYQIILEEGTGEETIASSDSVNLDYKGYLLSGEVFDENEEISFNTGNTIEGFKKGLEGLKKDSKAILIIPSDLAYGDVGIFNKSGYISIPPFEPLIFEVKINGF